MFKFIIFLGTFECIRGQLLCNYRFSGSVFANINDNAAVFPGCGAQYKSNGQYTSGRTETVTFTSTDDKYFLRAKCTIQMNDGSSNCQSQKFLVSRDGLSNLKGAEEFCGANETTFTRDSIGNQIVLGIRSTNDGKNGNFNCIVTAVYMGYSKCDCGWEVDVRTISFFFQNIPFIILFIRKKSIMVRMLR